MMKSYDESVEINHNPNWLYIPDSPYRISIIAGSGSGKTNVLWNLLKHQRQDIDKVYLYIKDPSINYLLTEEKKQELKIKKKAKEFIDYSRKVDNVYENLEDYKQAKKRRVLIVFNDMIEDMESNKELGPVVTELFLREKKSNFHLFLN